MVRVRLPSTAPATPGSRTTQRSASSPTPALPLPEQPGIPVAGSVRLLPSPSTGPATCGCQPERGWSSFPIQGSHFGERWLHGRRHGDADERRHHDGAGQRMDRELSGSFPTLTGVDVIELSSSGAALSGANGYGYASLSQFEQNAVNVVAVDGSGDVWLADNGTNNSVTELIGAATPVITPIAAGLPSTPTGNGTSNLGTRPGHAAPRSDAQELRRGTGAVCFLVDDDFSICTVRAVRRLTASDVVWPRTRAYPRG